MEALEAISAWDTGKEITVFCILSPGVFSVPFLYRNLVFWGGAMIAPAWEASVAEIVRD